MITMIPGKKVVIAGREYVAPPAPLGTVRRFAQTRKDFTPADPEYIGGTVAFIFEALRQNYPEITPEFIEDNVNVRQMRSVLAAIGEASGMEEGEETAGS